MKLWAIEADKLDYGKCGCCNWETSVFYVLANSYIEAVEWARKIIENEEGAPLCGDCMCELLSSVDYEIKRKEPFKILQEEVHTDILERISGKEVYIGGRRYRTADIERILTDPDDDTNESVKILLERLYKKIKKYKYFEIV